MDANEPSLRNHDSRAQILITVVNVILIIILLSCRRPSSSLLSVECIRNLFDIRHRRRQFDFISFVWFCAAVVACNCEQWFSHSHVIRAWTGSDRLHEQYWIKSCHKMFARGCCAKWKRRRYSCVGIDTFCSQDDRLQIEGRPRRLGSSEEK